MAFFFFFLWLFEVFLMAENLRGRFVPIFWWWFPVFDTVSKYLGELLPERLGPLQLELQGHLIHFELLLLFGGDEFGIMLLFLSLHLSLRKRARANISSDEPLSAWPVIVRSDTRHSGREGGLFFAAINHTGARKWKSIFISQLTQFFSHSHTLIHYAWSLREPVLQVKDTERGGLSNEVSQRGQKRRWVWFNRTPLAHLKIMNSLQVFLEAILREKANHPHK